MHGARGGWIERKFELLVPVKEKPRIAQRVIAVPRSRSVPGEPMIIDFHVHVLPPEDMPAFTGTGFHRNIGAVRRGDFPSSAQPDDRLPQCTQRRKTVPGSHHVLNSWRPER